MATLVSKDTSGCFVHPLGLPEALAERTRNGKVWPTAPTADGRKRADIGCQIGPIHYRADPFDADEQYKEIDLDVVLTPGESWDAACEANGYQVRFWQSRVYSGKTLRYIAQFRRAGKWLAMAPVALLWQNTAGQKQLISKPLAVGAPDIDNEANHVTWQNVFGPGLHYRYNLRPDEFFKTVIVDDKSDLPAPTIGLAGLRLVLVLALSWHGQSKAGNQFADSIQPTEPTDEIDDIDQPDEELDNPETFNFRDEFARDTWWLRKPRAWDSAEDKHGVAVDWSLRRKGSFVFAVLSVQASALNRPEVVYPVYVDVAIPEEQVGAGLDDCIAEYGGTPSFSGTTDHLRCGYLSSSFLGASVGLRFQTVPIPQGATIDTATMTLTAGEADAGTTVNSKLRAEDTDNAAAFSDITNWDTRFPGTVTTAEVLWDNLETWVQLVTYESPDISSVVEEVVGRGGWSSNNDLVLFWDDYDQRSSVSDNANRDASSYEDGVTRAAKFNASYTEAAPGGAGVVIGSTIIGSTVIGSTIIRRAA